MEVIKTYLDNVFAAYPQTSEVTALKRDMLANMEEKYTLLRQEGKSEHEAAYSVIANFGSIEEITAELGLDAKSGKMEEAISLPWEEAQAYLAKSKKSGMWVGLGVWLIIAGVSFVIFLDNVFVMFVAIAIAVTIFIINGSRMGAYESYEETHIRLDSYTRQSLEEDRARVGARCTAMVAVGVASIILSVGAFTIVDFPVTLFLNIIGFSVFLFILAGYYSASYDVLLGKGDYSNKAGVKKTGQIAAVYWPVATAIYLLWSFTMDAWHISWVVWPVAGVLFGAIWAYTAVWSGTKEKTNGRN